MPTGRGITTTETRQHNEPDALISAKDETIAMLREQLQAERQAHGEARRIIAGLVERMPDLEAPEGGPGSPETVDGSEAEQRRSQKAPHSNARESSEAEDV